MRRGNNNLLVLANLLLVACTTTNSFSNTTNLSTKPNYYLGYTHPDYRGISDANYSGRHVVFELGDGTTNIKETRSINVFIGQNDTNRWRDVSLNVQGDYTPYVGENGNWWIGDEDTGIPALDNSSQNSTNNNQEQNTGSVDTKDSDYVYYAVLAPANESIPPLLEQDNPCNALGDLLNELGYGYFKRWTSEIVSAPSECGFSCATLFPEDASLNHGYVHATIPLNDSILQKKYGQLALHEYEIGNKSGTIYWNAHEVIEYRRGENQISLLPYEEGIETHPVEKKEISPPSN